MAEPEQTDATQTDVSKEPEQTSSTPEQQPKQEETPKQLSAREETMNRIVEMREQIEQETIQPPPPEEHEGEGQEGQEGHQQQPVAATPPPRPQQETLRVKVDGVEQDIPVEQAKAILQKNMAADRRLEEATFRQQNLAQWEQQLREREQALQQQTPPKQQPGENENELKEQIQEAVDKLYDGDTDDAVETLTAVMKGRQAPTLDPAQISQQATDRVMQQLEQKRMQEEMVQAQNLFHSEYKDISLNPELYDMADKKTLAIQQQNPSWTLTQVIMEAGRQTQSWVDSLRQGNGSHHQSRVQRKAQLQGLPRTHGSMAFQPPEPDNGPTKPVDVIREMREARGQT